MVVVTGAVIIGALVAGAWTATVGRAARAARAVAGELLARRGHQFRREVAAVAKLVDCGTEGVAGDRSDVIVGAHEGHEGLSRVACELGLGRDRARGASLRECSTIEMNVAGVGNVASIRNRVAFQEVSVRVV